MAAIGMTASRVEKVAVMALAATSPMAVALMTQVIVADAAALAAGQLIGQAVGKGGKPKLVQQLISPWACLIGIGTQCQLQTDVLRHSQRGQQVIGLIDHADPGLAQGHAAAFGQGGQVG